jgi:hypothetical protein
MKENSEANYQNSRRNFLLMGCAAASVALFKACVSPLESNRAAGSAKDDPIIYCVPAAEMKARADAFRLNFTKNYLQTNTDYPIYDVLKGGNMLPVNNEDINRLLSRKIFKIENVTGQPDVRLLTNDGLLFNPMFTAVMNDNVVRFTLALPSHLQILARMSAQSLEFEIISKLVVHLVDKIPNLPLIYDDQVLKKVTLTGDFLMYEFEENGAPERKFNIKLDFTGNGCSGRSNLRSVFRSVMTATKLGVLGLALLFSFGNSCTNHGHATGAAKCLAPYCPTEDSTREISRACSTASNGVLTENGKTYFRIDRNIQDPTFCTFTRADDLAPRCSLTKVCANVVPPADWHESDLQQDKNACDHPTNPTTNNVKILTKCFHISLSPGSDSEPIVALKDATNGTPYEQAFSATDDVPNDCTKPSYIFRKVSGTFPPGVTIDETSGRLSGVPSVGGQTFSFTIAAVASDTGCVGKRDYRLRVN